MEQQLVTDKLLSLFKINVGGELLPADKVLTKTQKEIFRALVFRDNLRLQIITPTQYGKSLTVALASIILSCVMKEMVSIVAPSNEKAKIIMRYYIEHLGDSPVFYEQLEKDTKLERLRMEESKDRIMLKNGGGVYVLSAQASNSRRGIEAAMGMGAKNTILDEAALISDEIEATVFRMVAGHKDGFYCKIGNPFRRNHFLQTWQNPKYAKIFIDAEEAVKEGRYTREYIEEAKTRPLASVLWDCIFPSEDEIDDAGYLPLLSEKELKFKSKEGFGERRLGLDVAEWGGNYNVLLLRTADYAKILLRWRDENTMNAAGMALKFAKDYDILDQNIFIDEIGVGKGVVDRLHEQGRKVHGVKSSEQADDDAQFFNKRAENYWRVKQWLRDAELEPSSYWKELLGMRYKVVESSGRLIMMPKELMRSRGIQSPDVADALSLTFARKSVLNPQKIQEAKMVRQFDFFKKHARKKLFTGSRYLNS